MKLFKIFSVLALVLSSFSLNAYAKIYDENALPEKVKQTPTTYHILKLEKDDTVDLPAHYNAKIITNPETGQRLLKIPAKYEERGVKKEIIVYALRNGGKYFDNLVEFASPKTATYVKRYRNKVADAIDKSSSMLEGEVLQALIKAGVPQVHARNIAWVVTAVLW